MPKKVAVLCYRQKYASAVVVEMSVSSTQCIFRRYALHAGGPLPSAPTLGLSQRVGLKAKTWKVSLKRRAKHSIETVDPNNVLRVAAQTESVIEPCSTFCSVLQPLCISMPLVVSSKKVCGVKESSVTC